MNARPRFPSRWYLVALPVSAFSALPCGAQVVASEWNHASGNWNVAANWNPADVPDNGGTFTYNVQIGNLPIAASAAVTFIPEDGTADTITSLSMLANADLFTNGSQLNVTGQTTLDGAGTTVRVDPHATPATASFTSLNIDVNGGSAVTMNGGRLTVADQLEINAGSTLRGYGSIDLGNADALVEQAFENSGTISAIGTSANPGTLTLHASGVDTIDLDGDSEVGIIDVSNAVADLELDSLTLIVDGPLSDDFGAGLTPGATLLIGQRDTVTFNKNFAIDAGSIITMDGGTGLAKINGPAAITDVGGADFTITGAAEIDNAMTFTGTGNTISVNSASSLRLNGAVDIPDASALSLTASSSQLLIGGDVVISEPAGDFNWDGPAFASTTIDGTGQLSFFVNRIDSGDNTFNGTVNLQDSGDLLVDNVANLWTLAGTLNKTGGGTSTIAGDPVIVTGTITASGGLLDLPQTTLQAAAQVTVNSQLALGGASVLAGPAALTGPGLLRMDGTSFITANTTVNTAGFDWDGAGSGTTHTINDGIVFTINSTVWDPDDTGDVDDNINLGGNGAQLLVNGVPTWTMPRTLNANTALAGTATIGGSSRLLLEGPSAVLNVDGNTNLTAPVTFGTSSFANIDAGMVLDLGSTATFKGGTITGAGNFRPASTNLVTASSTISSTNFDFDVGDWTIQDNALLTVNVGDYDPDVATNGFDGIINLESSDLSMNSGDAAFVMDGTLNMASTVAGLVTTWGGEPVSIGNDTSLLDANLNVSGTGTSRFSTPVEFYSDADVNVDAGAFLDFTGTASFLTANGANNAEFTGAGTLSFTGPVNITEAATLNMTGGTVDLDGVDATGDLINIDGPLTINASIMSSFGRTNSSGVNVIDINNSAGTGILTVNLDNPTREWTLNPAGQMILFNDNTNAALLAGNDLNLNGSVSVTGEVEIDCRVDIGGTIAINTAGEILHLAGGFTDTSPNRMVGGTINGPGAIGAPDIRELRGFGTINAPVDFDGSGTLRADDGSLTLTGAILDVGTIGTANATGFLNVTNAWNSSVASNVILNGGELQGGAITISNTGGIRGQGLVSARIINNVRIQADAGTLVFKTAANNNDWDGAANTAQIVAGNGGTLELNDDANFPFGGTVIADHARVYAKGFGLTHNGGMSLLSGTFESDESTTVNGSVVSNVGGDSIFKVQNNRFLTFTPTSQVTLISNLHLQNNNINIEAGTTFSGASALIIDEGSHAIADNGAEIDVLVDLRGDFRPGGFETIGRVDIRDFQQGPESTLFVEITGTGLNQFDRLVIDGAAQLAGRLNVDIDGGFVPIAGQTFDILSAPGGISGQFNGVEFSGMPAGLTPVVTYLPGIARVTMVAGTQYEIWINSFASITNPADRLKTADPDKDGFDNLTEFALNGNPAQAKGIDKIFPKIAQVGGEAVFTLTAPIRVQTGPIDVTPGFDLIDISLSFRYSIQASDTLLTFPLNVTEVTGADANAIQTGLPAIDPGWEYRTFHSPGPVAGDPREFMRVVVEAL